MDKFQRYVAAEKRKQDIKTIGKYAKSSKRMIINCTMVIDGTTSVVPLTLKKDNDKYWAIISVEKDREVTIELDASLVESPVSGVEAWNYKGGPFVLESRKKQ